MTLAWMRGELPDLWRGEPDDDDNADLELADGALSDGDDHDDDPTRLADAGTLL